MGMMKTRIPTARAALPIAILLLLMASAAPAQAVWNYFDRAEALEIAFPDGERVAKVPFETLQMLDADLRMEIEAALGHALVLGNTECFQGSRDGSIVGYACIDNVIGRSLPITFMFKIDHPSGEIVWYEVMVYREAIGRSVRRGPFREQFIGKTFQDSLRYGEDLRSIAGATMSCDGLKMAFRKLLFLYEYHLRNLPLLAEGSIEEMKIQEYIR